MNPKKKQKTMVMKSPLTAEFFYVNKYKDKGNGNFEAISKRKATKEEIAEYKKQIKKQKAEGETRLKRIEYGQSEYRRGYRVAKKYYIKNLKAKIDKRIEVLCKTKESNHKEKCCCFTCYIACLKIQELNFCLALLEEE